MAGQKTETARLPDGFAALEALVEEGWALGTWPERNAKRYASGMAELQSFYDQLMQHAERALAYLATKKLDDLAQSDRTLLELLLMLTEASFPIERYGQVPTPNGYDTAGFPEWNPRPPGPVP